MGQSSPSKHLHLHFLQTKILCFNTTYTTRKTEANEDKDEDEDEDKDNPVQPSTVYHPHFIVTPFRPFQNT